MENIEYELEETTYNGYTFTYRKAIKPENCNTITNEEIALYNLKEMFKEYSRALEVENDKLKIRLQTYKDVIVNLPASKLLDELIPFMRIEKNCIVLDEVYIFITDKEKLKEFEEYINDKKGKI